VSQQIATLERAIGHRLVERPGGPRPVSLTEAGQVLLRHASHITARLGAAKADLDALAAGEAGVLRVGTFQSASARLLPPTLVRFRDGWPGVTVELRNETPGDPLNDLVRAGLLDLAFADVTSIGEPFAAEPLIDDAYVLMAAPGSAFADVAMVDLASLDGERMVAASTDDACSVRISAALREAGAHTHIVFRSDDNLTAQRLVSSGLGVAIVPLLAVELQVPDAEVVVVPLHPRHNLVRRIGIVWHGDRYRSRAAEAFTATAVEVGRSLQLPHLTRPLAVS
jgi:DNA-binding transcriptional LysR family regulator